MNIKIHWSVVDIDATPAYYRAMLKQVIMAGAKLVGAPPCEISISFVSMDKICKLNKEYRQKDSPTDVLSFPGVDDHKITGDIIICTEVAAKQASEYGHSLDREMAFLTAHGFFHLAGYDHQNAGDEKEMIDLQNETLEIVGISR